MFLIARSSALLRSAFVSIFALNISPENLLNSVAVEYLAWLGYFLTSQIFVWKSALVTDPVTTDILFSNSPICVIKPVLVTNPLTSGILFSTSPIFVLKPVLVTELLVSGIFLSMPSNFYLNLYLH